MRNGEVIYHCKRVSGTNVQIQTFEPPYAIRLALHHFTVQPSSGYTDVMAYGEDISQYQNGMAQPYQKWHGVISEGDRFYLDGAKPSTDDYSDSTADNANYVVDSVRNQNEAIRIIFKKRTRK